MPELRVVKNVGDDTFFDAFDGVDYAVQPGASVMVPVEAVNLWCGDHSLIDTPQRQRRKEELARLRVRYGAAVLDTLGEPDDGCFPKLEVTTVDGTPVETVLSDPEGKTVVQASSTVSEKEHLLDLIRQQQADLAMLREQFRKKAREEEALSAAQLVEDSPQNPPSRKARANV